MNDLFLTGMNRRSRNAVENQRKSLRRRARDGLHRLLGAVDALVAAEGAQTVTDFRDALGTPALIEAAIACRAYERLEERGHLDAMLARYGTLRQYLPAFFALPFQAAAGSETILKAIEILRALDAGTRGALTTDDPHGFVQADWRPHLITRRQTRPRHLGNRPRLRGARRLARRQPVPGAKPRSRLVLEPGL